MAENTQSADAPPEVSLRLTAKAIQQVKVLLQKNSSDSQGLRVWVTDGGCSGFSYKLGFEPGPKSEDIILDIDGVEVYIDSPSLPYLQGTVIDYVDTLHGGGFKFTNPNATATCGCGTSFSA